MKVKYFSCLLMLMWSATSIACDCKSIIIGEWSNDEYKIRYEFKNDSVIFQQLNNVINANYTIDTEKTPHHLTLTIRNGAMKMDIPALLECLDANTIVIEQFAPATTPTEFSKEGGLMNRKHTLKRKN